MAQVKDILIDDDNEIRFLSGDFFVGSSDEQHIQHILQASKGNYLQAPTLGVQISDFISGNIAINELTKRIRLELIKDGYLVNSVEIDSEGAIQVDAKRRNA